jgi:hypothetical protein
MTTKQLLKKEIWEIHEEMKDSHIIDMYYSGWECDSKVVILKDGRVFGTNHGYTCELSLEYLKDYLLNLQTYINDTTNIINSIEKENNK